MIFTWYSEGFVPYGFFYEFCFALVAHYPALYEAVYFLAREDLNIVDAEGAQKIGVNHNFRGGKDYKELGYKP